MISPELREFAEAPNVYVTLEQGIQRFLTDRYSLVLGPFPFITSVQRVRGEPDELAAILTEVRGLVEQHGHTNTIWFLTDDRHYEELHRLGVDELDELTAVALAEPPEPGPPEIVVTVAETFEAYTQAREVEWEAFAWDEKVVERSRGELAEGFRLEREGSAVVTFLARLDGDPVGAAMGLYGERGGNLLGGGTLPRARNRGVYRALVRARWDEAVRRGTPAIVSHAGPLSEPILRGLGFEEVCRIRRLKEMA